MSDNEFFTDTQWEDFMFSLNQMAQDEKIPATTVEEEQEDE